MSRSVGFVYLNQWQFEKKNLKASFDAFDKQFL